MLDKYNLLRCNYTVQETEEYLHEVVDKKYNERQIQQILEALDLARYAHRNCYRGDNAPYIIHPMRVALMILNFDPDTITKVFIAGLLHDTLEKTELTFSDIEDRFGRYVAKLVQTITRKHLEGQSFQEKIEAKRQNWLEVISNGHEARMIKICEDLDNMICWKNIPEGAQARKKIPRWLKEAKEMSLPLAHVTNVQAYKLMCQEYGYYVERGFADQPVTI